MNTLDNDSGNLMNELKIVQDSNRKLNDDIRALKQEREQTRQTIEQSHKDVASLKAEMDARSSNVKYQLDDLHERLDSTLEENETLKHFFQEVRDELSCFDDDTSGTTKQGIQQIRDLKEKYTQIQLEMNTFTSKYFFHHITEELLKISEFK